MTILQAANIAAETKSEELFLARVIGDEDLYLPVNWDAVSAHMKEVYRLTHLSMKEIRAETGLSQLALSAKTGIPRRTIENWDSGTSTPPTYEKCLLLSALGLLDPPYPIPEPEEEVDDLE